LTIADRPRPGIGSAKMAASKWPLAARGQHYLVKLIHQFDVRQLERFVPKFFRAAVEAHHRNRTLTLCWNPIRFEPFWAKSDRRSALVSGLRLPTVGTSLESWRRRWLAQNRRDFALPSGLGKIIGKPLLYSLANSWAKLYRVDTLRDHADTDKEF
jgi:hypothetical protein